MLGVHSNQPRATLDPALREGVVIAAKTRHPAISCSCSLVASLLQAGRQAGTADADVERGLLVVFE
jgi:hypothetical protein